MIARPTLVPSARPDRATHAHSAPVAGADLIPASAMQAFAMGIDITLAAALIRQGEKPSSVTVQRLSRAYAPQPVKPSVKLRRYA